METSCRRGNGETEFGRYKMLEQHGVLECEGNKTATAVKLLHVEEPRL